MRPRTPCNMCTMHACQHTSHMGHRHMSVHYTIPHGQVMSGHHPPSVQSPSLYMHPTHPPTCETPNPHNALRNRSHSTPAIPNKCAIPPQSFLCKYTTTTHNPLIRFLTIHRHNQRVCLLQIYSHLQTPPLCIASPACRRKSSQSEPGNTMQHADLHPHEKTRRQSSTWAKPCPCHNDTKQSWHRSFCATFYDNFATPNTPHQQICFAKLPVSLDSIERFIQRAAELDDVEILDHLLDNLNGREIRDAHLINCFTSNASPSPSFVRHFLERRPNFAIAQQVFFRSRFDDDAHNSFPSGCTAAVLAFGDPEHAVEFLDLFCIEHKCPLMTPKDDPTTHIGALVKYACENPSSDDEHIEKLLDIAQTTLPHETPFDVSDAMFYVMDMGNQFAFKILCNHPATCKKFLCEDWFDKWDYAPPCFKAFESINDPGTSIPDECYEEISLLLVPFVSRRLLRRFANDNSMLDSFTAACRLRLDALPQVFLGLFAPAKTTDISRPLVRVAHSYRRLLDPNAIAMIGDYL